MEEAHQRTEKRRKQNRAEYVVGDRTRVRAALRAANSREGDSSAKFTIELSDVEPEVAGTGDPFAAVLNQKLPAHTLW